MTSTFSLAVGGEGGVCVNTQYAIAAVDNSIYPSSYPAPHPLPAPTPFPRAELLIQSWLQD